MQVNKEDIQKWCDALRSGEYKQARTDLQNTNGHCCLGVACEIFIPKTKQQRNSKGFLAFGCPRFQKASPEWLKKIDVNFLKLTGSGLINLNDWKEFTFDEIADCLEAVYIHEVLK